jgi:hypothetical protein
MLSVMGTLLCLCSHPYINHSEYSDETRFAVLCDVPGCEGPCDTPLFELESHVHSA